MDQLIRILFLIPMLVVTLFSTIRDNPQRVFKGSDLPVEAPAGSWKQAKPLPTMRYDFGANTFKNKLVIVGGLVLPSPWFPTKRVEAYDPKTDTWARLPDYPRLAHHIGVVECDGNLYGIAGYWLRVFPQNDMYMYSAKNNAWERKADLPVARGAMGVACLNDKIYVAGGEDKNGQLNSFVVYDPKTDTWTVKKPMPTAREHMAVVASHGKIFVIGGLNPDRFHSLAVVEMYDPTSDTWTTVSPLPYTLNGFFAAALGDSIYVFGGARGDATTNEVFEYKVLENRWVRRANMPVSRYGYALGVIGNTVHIVGGNAIVKGNYFHLEHDVFTP